MDQRDGAPLLSSFSEERLRGFVCPTWRREGSRAPFLQYMNRAFQKDGDRLFSRFCYSRTRSSAFKL